MNTTPERKRNAHWRTPRRSSTSVKVCWLDRSRLMKRLNRSARYQTTGVGVGVDVVV